MVAETPPLVADLVPLTVLDFGWKLGVTQHDEELERELSVCELSEREARELRDGLTLWLQQKVADRVGLQPVEFTIPGKPKPKGNAKRIAKLFGSKTPTIINDRDVQRKQRDFSVAAMKFRPEVNGIWECPIRLEVTFVFKAPQKPKWKWAAALKGILLHVVRPDTDNLTKFVKDALEEIFYVDDKQVCEEYVRKIYGPQAETRIKLIPLEQATKDMV